MENVDFRIDGEFHRKPFPKNPKHQYTKIENILTFVQYGVSIDMNEENVGYPIYRMNEISNMLCNTEVLKCANLTPNEANQYILEENDVLFNRTNSQHFVGRTGIFKKFSENPYIFASYLIRLRTDESKVLPEYLTTFLSCKYGIWDIKRRARISINQSNVNAEEVKATIIPLLDIEFQKQLRELFDKAHSLREESKALYAEAENLLLAELGLRDWQPTNEQTAVKSFRESFLETGRLDAEYYQPKYDYALAKLKELKPKAIVPLESLLDVITNGQTPLHHDLSVGDVAFLTAEHMFDFRINYNSEKRVELEHHAGQLAKTEVIKGDVLITIKGKIGNAAVVEDVPRPTNINQDVGLLRLKDGVNPYFVAGFINSVIGKMFTKQISTGQINPFLGLGNLRTIPIPLFDNADEIGERLKQKVIEAETVNQKSKRLLELAKRAVETAIEENETSALKMISAAGVI